MKINTAFRWNIQLEYVSQCFIDSLAALALLRCRTFKKGLNSFIFRTIKTCGGTKCIENTFCIGSQWLVCKVVRLVFKWLESICLSIIRLFSFDSSIFFKEEWAKVSKFYSKKVLTVFSMQNVTDIVWNLWTISIRFREGRVGHNQVVLLMRLTTHLAWYRCFSSLQLIDQICCIKLVSLRTTS